MILNFLRHLPAYVPPEKFRFDQETLGHIGTIDGLRSDVSHRYSHFARRIEYSTSILGCVESPLDYLIGELYPIIVQDGQEVYFCHPVILSALSALDRAHTIRDKNKAILINFIRLLEKLKSEKEFLILRFTDEAEYFKKIGVDFSTLCSVLL